MHNTFSEISTLILNHIQNKPPSIWPTISAIGTISAVIVSLILAVFVPLYTETLRRRPKKTNLIFEAPATHRQNNDYIGRLVIKNNSDNVAALVEASVISIIKNGTPLDDFLPVPLNWTHINNTRRDIHGNQTVYLDIIMLHTPSPEDTFYLASIGINNDEQFPLEISGSKLIVSVYQESGQVVTKKVKLIRNGNVPELRITS